MDNFKIIYKTILKSNFFSKIFYVEKYLFNSIKDPIAHYILEGASAGNNPSILFDTLFYLRRYPDVLDAGINPLYHFIDSGEKEGRIPIAHSSWKDFDTIYKILNNSPLFDSEWYKLRYPDIAQSGVDPLTHYIEFGAYEGRSSSSEFDSAFYLNSNTDVFFESINPLYHYITYGRYEGRLPKKEFNKNQLIFDNDLFNKNKITNNFGLISIILPTKNRNKQLKKAIESIINQTYLNWELIIIEDGGCIKSIVNKFIKDKRIFYYKNNEFNGVSGARNLGLKKSSGKFIAYLDDDNVWLPRYIELMLHKLIDENADCIYAILKCINYDETIESEKIFYRYEDFDFEKLKVSNYIDLNVFIHTRDIYLKEGGFDLKLKRMVDWDLILRYTRENKVAFLEYVGCEYDNSSFAPRISNLENLSYLNVIREKNWIDWDVMELNLKYRNPNLISIIICIHDQLKLTEQCLESLYTHPAGENFELILVDNGSDPITSSGLRDWASKYSNILVVTNPSNFGFSLGNNIGFMHSQGHRVVFLNNDTEVSPEWLRSLVRPLNDLEIKGVQPKLLYPNGNIQCVGVVFSNKSTLGYPIYKGLPGDFLPSMKSRYFSAITAACLAVRASDFISCRGFDTHFLNGQEDIDFCLRLGGGSKVFYCAADSIVTHHENKTIGRGLFINENRKIFIERWSDVVLPDDEFYYKNDGIDVINYYSDNANSKNSNYSIFQPILNIKEKLSSSISSINSIAIKIACPDINLKDNWGDYHFAVSLCSAFRRKGISSQIYFSQESNICAKEDVSLVLRGLSKFEINPYQINIAWIISHPDKIQLDELNMYDKVFVASGLYVKKLRDSGLCSAEELLQCTDISRFYPFEIPPIRYINNLFCANSRNVLRKVIDFAITEGIAINIYGEMHEGIAPDYMIKGNKIDNVDLPNYYRHSDVVLNDHWDSMLQEGFVSNRVFDVLSCASPLVTDKVNEFPKDIEKMCFFFDNDNHTLFDAIEEAKKSSLLNYDDHLDMAKYIHSEHSFDNRATYILNSIEVLVDQKINSFLN